MEGSQKRFRNIAVSRKTMKKGHKEKFKIKNVLQPLPLPLFRLPLVFSMFCNISMEMMVMTK